MIIAPKLEKCMIGVFLYNIMNGITRLIELMIKKNGLKLEHSYQSQRRKGKEVFIANYDLEKPARFTPLQLSLFDGY